MKSFTSKINGKLNNCNKALQTCGRPAAEKRPRADHNNDRNPNAGFSLPEIIVAMLIVGIVIVPLLTNFAVTARVNAKSLKTNDATDYAEQIMETLKSYTPEEVDAQFGGEPGNFKITDVTGNTSYGRTDSSFSTDQKQDKSESGQPRYYFIKGAAAPSGRTYNVQITYDPVQYTTGKTTDGKPDGTVHSYNLEEFPDISAFAGGTSITIDPNDPHVTFEQDENKNYIFDEDSQSYKFENNTSYEETAVNTIYSVYNEFLNDVAAKFNDLLEEKAGSGNFIPLTRDDFSDGVSETVKKNKLRSLMNRYTLLRVDAVDGRTYIASYMQFFLDDNDDINIIDDVTAKSKAKDKLGNLLGEEGERLIPDDVIDTTIDDIVKNIRATRSSEIVPSYNILYDRDGYGKLDTVYLMMKPLSRDFKKDRIAVYFTEGAEKKYNETNRLNIYIAPQVGLLSNKDPNMYIKPQITGVNKPSIKYDDKTDSYDLTAKLTDEMTGLPDTKMAVNYAKEWFDPSGFSYNSLRDNASDDIVKKATGDLIYDIKVAVYDASGRNWSNKLIELNTSGQQQ